MKRKRLTVRFSVDRNPKPKPDAARGRGDASTQGHGHTITGRFELELRRPRGELDAATSPGHPPYSLLITDDDDAFRETLRSIFEPEGFHTLLAHSGEEALDILSEKQVHLAMLDQNLPCLTGLETLRIIRQANAILPVILMTAQNTQHLLREALSAHAFCVMSKPVTRSVVVYTVHQALSRSYDPSPKTLGGGEFAP
jgi:CheY-like chemotaxis protein